MARTLSYWTHKVNHLYPPRQPAYGHAMEHGPDPGTRKDASRRAAEDAALADLARLRQESDALGSLFGRARAHFGAADTPAGDPAELWGRRIGRTLSAIAVVALAVYLYLTYVR
ncbi:MAG: hypothetical protein ACOY5F_08540 [Pseudomonadota bacterium]